MAVPGPGVVLIGRVARGDPGRVAAELEVVRNQDPVKGPSSHFLGFFDGPSSLGDGACLASPDKLIPNELCFVGPTGSPIVWNRENKLSQMVVHFKGQAKHV